MKDVAKPDAAHRDWIEILATVLLSLAAVATAWSSYQANRWHGEQATAMSTTNRIRIEASRSSDLANAQTEVDVATFIQWIDANATGEAMLADFYDQRFRPEFRPAFDAWIATDPFTEPGAPPTPFAMPEYRVAAKIEAARLDRAAERSSEEGRRDIQRASNYVLAVVLFAVALFFAAMCTKLHGRNSRIAMLVVGTVVFVSAVAWIATFPVSVEV
jgi:ferric-dicitrate binding protein FerR (iron transport regulator)